MFYFFESKLHIFMLLILLKNELLLKQFLFLIYLLEQSSFRQVLSIYSDKWR